MSVYPVNYVGNKNNAAHYHGEGKITYSDGSVYEGNFLNGKRSGYGVYKVPETHTYKG